MVIYAAHMQLICSSCAMLVVGCNVHVVGMESEW